MSARRWATRCFNSSMRTRSGSNCRLNEASNCSSDARPTLASVNSVLASSRLPRNPSTTVPTSSTLLPEVRSFSSSETSSAAS